MTLRQAWDLPAAPRAIVIIGAGGIVRDAHLKAYQRLKFPVAGAYDKDGAKAASLVKDFSLGRAFASLEEAAAQPGAVFDIAVPARFISAILPSLPDGAGVLIQKPMGENLAQAEEILGICRKKGLKAAVNFQLRFSPNMLAMADMLKQGLLGDLVDIDLRVVIDQPWGHWDFLKGIPRVEFLYHSIHYLDLIRRLAGEPEGVYAKGVRHPSFPGLADTRSSIILDYGDQLRCSLVLNHSHKPGPKQRCSQLMLEGLKGAARTTMGVNLKYPGGEPDTMETALGGDWSPLPLRGSWFTEAFEGPMSNLQRFISGEDQALVSPVEDAIKTMALVEACYQSSASGATAIPLWQGA